MAALKALVAFMAMAAIAELATGKSYTIKWALNENYADWASKNMIHVGDSILFTYTSVHTVDELSKADYEACSFSNSISSDKSGNTTVTFDKAGTRYFACATGNHCVQGQKITIDVMDTSSPTTESPPKTPTVTSPPKENSAAPNNNLGLVMKIVLALSLGGIMLVAF